MKIEVVKSDKHSSNFDVRYVVINSETKQILDDAQGYGYKTKKNAYKAWTYKNRTSEQNKKLNNKKNRIKQWIKSHNSFMETLEANLLYALKDKEDIDDEIVKKWIFKEDPTVNFTVKELFKVWND